VEKTRNIRRANFVLELEEYPILKDLITKDGKRALIMGKLDQLEINIKHLGRFSKMIFMDGTFKSSSDLAYQLYIQSMASSATLIKGRQFRLPIVLHPLHLTKKGRHTTLFSKALSGSPATRTQSFGRKGNSENCSFDENCSNSTFFLYI
jgi:hypothetical protein